MIIFNSYFLSFVIVFCGNLVFFSNRKHLLIVLLSLEFIILSLFFFFFTWLSYLNIEFYFLILFLVMLACEGVLGVSILVSMIRTHGNDYFHSIRIL